jgi:hypothetical protein
MDEARTVLARLGRIEALDDAGAPAGLLLDEVRALVAEAAAWVGVERHCGGAGEGPALPLPGSAEAVAAVERLRATLEGALRQM